MNYTIQFEHEYNQLSSGQMTPAMAAEYLRGGHIILRSFPETLKALYPENDLQDRLIAEFSVKAESVPGSIPPDFDDSKCPAHSKNTNSANKKNANSDSASRKIRGWLSGQTRPTDREDIFRIAFALRLSESDTGLLLGLCTEYGIHYRNGRDVVYAWFLRMGFSYCEAKEFFDTLPPIPSLGLLPADAPSNLTHQLQNTFLRVQTKEELRQCYMENIPKFGTLHARAWFYFQKYLDQLIRPIVSYNGVDEANYSLEAVMEQYFSLHMPSSKKRQGYSVVQKLLKQNWPNLTTLRNIRLQKTDVPRKLLLLLYVATENIMDDSYHELDEEYITMQERLEDHMWTLNAILTDCGMPVLDLHNAMDWLVLYAITAEDEPMSERMEAVLAQLFADVD